MFEHHSTAESWIINDGSNVCPANAGFVPTCMTFSRILLQERGKSLLEDAQVQAGCRFTVCMLLRADGIYASTTQEARNERVLYYVTVALHFGRRCFVRRIDELEAVTISQNGARKRAKILSIVNGLATIFLKIIHRCPSLRAHPSCTCSPADVDRLRSL